MFETPTQDSEMWWNLAYHIIAQFSCIELMELEMKETDYYWLFILAQNDASKTSSQFESQSAT